MTTRELNRDIKRLYQEHYRRTFETSTEFFNWWEAEGKNEFLRLYEADSEARYLTLNSYKAMQRLNQSERIVPFHLFYIKADPQY